MIKKAVKELVAKRLHATLAVPIVALPRLSVVVAFLTLTVVVVSTVDVDVVDVDVVEVVVVTVVVVSPGRRASTGPHPPMVCPSGLDILNNQPPENPPSQKLTSPPSEMTAPAGLVACESITK